MLLSYLRMIHCIFEAQSNSAHEVEAAAHHLMQKEEGGHLYFRFRTLTAYDMEAIGFVISSSPGDLKRLAL